MGRSFLLRALAESSDGLYVSAVAWRRARRTFVSRILGPHFEDCAREWLRAQPDPALRGDAVIVSATVVNDQKGRAKHEIDVVALDKRSGRATISLIGEAKATVTRRSVTDLERLERIRALLAEQGHETGKAVLALFSIEGFQPDLVSVARRRGMCCWSICPP